MGPASSGDSAGNGSSASLAASLVGGTVALMAGLMSVLCALRGLRAVLAAGRGVVASGCEDCVDGTVLGVLSAAAIFSCLNTRQPRTVALLTALSQYQNKINSPIVNLSVRPLRQTRLLCQAVAEYGIVEDDCSRVSSPVSEV